MKKKKLKKEIRKTFKKMKKFFKKLPPNQKKIFYEFLDEIQPLFLEVVSGCDEELSINKPIYY